MYYLLTALSGLLTAVMIVCNGGLSARYGVYTANVMIHISGLLLITAVILLKKEKIKIKKMPWYFYTGGLIGVATVIFNSTAFGRISVSAILALSLLGQSIASILVDEFGLFGMQRHPMKKGKIIGVVSVACGICFMVTELEFVAILISFLSGINLVVSRTLNARLAEKTSANISTLCNYIVGLAGAVPVMFLLGRGGGPLGPLVMPAQAYIYFGGLLGVAVVFLSNIIVTKIPAFYMTLFLFISQLFSGIVLDIVLSGTFSIHNLIGGVIVMAGLCINLMMDQKKPQIQKI